MKDKTTKACVIATMELGLSRLDANGPWSEPLAYSVVAQFAEDNELKSTLFLTKEVGKALIDLGYAMHGLGEKIDDADTCYRDPTLSNAGFDSLPEWARDMIVKSHQDPA